MYYEIRQKSQDLSHVSVADAVRLINKGAVVVDVRPTQEYGAGHIVNAKNVELSQIEDDSGPLSKYKKKIILTVCNSGLSSARAASKLRKAGFDQAFSIRGGIAAWRKENLPITK
jgi:rhodanese-related sulfurtransferase